MISANSCGFIIPLIINKNRLLDIGLKFKFFSEIKKNIFDCDYLILDSKLFKYDWGADKVKRTKDFFFNLKENVNKLIFLDLSDSSSTIINEALEIVDIYLKNQIYKNKNLYLKPMYGRRIFTNYYHKKFKIKDKESENSVPVKNKKNLKKIKISWNSYFSNYSIFGDLKIQLYKLFPFKFFLNIPKVVKSKNKKQNDVSCRMGLKYSKETVSFQRKKINEILKRSYNFKKVSKKIYFQELKKSKILISPFGYGEINLKDFEAFFYNCLLFKANMDHLETWPNFYLRDKTYVDFNWDLDDFKNKLNHIIKNFERYSEIANYTNNLYNSYLHDEKYLEEFCVRLKNILNN
jgi:hypothetical protein